MSLSKRKEFERAGRPVSGSPPNRPRFNRMELMRLQGTVGTGGIVNEGK